MINDPNKKIISTQEMDDLAIKPGEDYAIQDMSYEQGLSFFKDFWQHLEIKKKEFIGSFYIEYMFKKEVLFHNMQRCSKPIGRYSAPTPSLQQAVFYYDAEDDKAELLWILPDITRCYDLIANYKTLNEVDRSLIPTIVQYFTGDLLKMVKKRNKETGINEGIILIKEEN